MSRRNTRQQKKIRKLRKALRTPIPAWVDLVSWLKLYSHADTTGQARKLILDGRVKSESHIVGQVKAKGVDGKTQTFVERLQPASIQATLRVEPGDDVA